MKFDISKIKFSKADLMKDLLIPEQISEELAEETGLHIGDGSMNFYRQKEKLKGIYSLRGHLIDDKKHYDTRIKELYFKLYNLKISLREMKNSGVYGFQIWSDALVNFKNKILNLPLGKKLDVKIHPILINKFPISTIRGIFDTDGCLYLEKKNNKLYPRIQIANISKSVIEQLKNILKKNGFVVTKVTRFRQEQHWNTLHIISIRGDKMLRKWMDIIQPKNPKHIRKFKSYLDN